MAEYIKFRLTAAKVGVSMALLALIAGVAEKARSGPPQVTATPAANFLKLTGLTSAISGNFVKIEAKFLKIESSLLKFESKVAKSFYDKSAVNAKFLKITDANKKYLKLTDANAKFLKIDDANAKFRKIDDASAKFLKIDDANAQFLKVGGTAADSSKLGGMTPDAFVQGRGNIVSGAVTVPVSANGSPQPLLQAQTPAGIIVVSVSANADGVRLTIHNGTGVALPAVQDGNGTPLTLDPTQDSTVRLGAVGSANQTHIQVFADGSVRQALTLIVSSAQPAAGGAVSVVGQMLIGLL